MKQDRDEQQDKKMTKSLPLITAKQNATDLQSLLDYLKLHQPEVKKTLTNYGAIAIRGYEVKTPKQFQQVGLSIFPNLQNQYPGGAPREKVTEYVWNAAELPSYVPIPGHTELSYSPSDKPAYILFFCPQVAASDGETPVIDMKSVLSDLPEQLQQKCFHHRLVTKLFFVSTQKRLFDVRLWKWPWFRYAKSWRDVFNTEDRDLIEAKCRDVGRHIEWLTNGELIVSCPMPTINSHPIANEIVWTGWLPVFHIWGICIEAWFVAKYQRKFRSWLVFFILFLLTFVQICREKIIPGYRKYRYMDVAFEDRANLTFWDVYHIVKSYWQNAELFDWQEGDILILDNYRMGHGRLPFTGERRVYTAFA
ncbi:MAG: TauD/TfdA family dioxygenase [Hormoscilla sp. GUM202]|nr:TauD/TfdA family dioxygenase [Hormoscilla sp. GM7CHS1pb]MBO1349877.1 TauD/TfdA family dioxygenase [Hormoscilla sp. GUM202]